MTYDLATKDNWQLILSEQRNVTYRDNTLPANDEYRYTPIPPIYATPYAHTLLIGAKSNTALSHWFLAARASQYLYVSPSLTSGIDPGVQASDTKRIGLNRLTLIEFKDYGITPYTLVLEIPYWLEHIHIEAWEYKGTMPSEQLEFDTSDIIERLQRIEEKVDSGGNFDYI